MWRDAPTAEPHLDPGLGPGLSSANRQATDKWPGHHTHARWRGRWRQTNGRIMRSGDRQRCRDNPLHCSDICRALAGISITEIYWSYLYNVLLPSNKLPPLQNLLITIWCGCYHTSRYRNIPIPCSSNCLAVTCYQSGEADMGQAHTLHIIIMMLQLFTDLWKHPSILQS